ncbi:MAG TPA: hypothetical protein VF727_09555 [Allosphingosinicella sp.]|jgi:hypothetical protein
MLNRLPRGITGFFGDPEAAHAVDPHAFKRACHLAAQVQNGSIEGIDLNVLGRSYYGATVRTSVEEVSVVANCVHPFIAFVPPGHFGMGFPLLNFVEPVSLADTFAALTEFRPLSVTWLRSELDRELLAELAPAELRQLKYWKPQRIGDVIFNSWD